MTQDEIIEMARQAGLDIGVWEKLYDDDLLGYSVQGIHEDLEAFAKLVAAKERERISALNAPEIEKCNAYIKKLEQRIHALSLLRGEA